MSRFPDLERKSQWMKLTAASFLSLTFADLRPGDEFIVLPAPGDNNGRGGFKQIHHVSIKTQQIEDERSGVRWNAVRKNSGNLAGFMDSTPVIKLG